MGLRCDASIVGARRPAQIDGWLGAAGLQLTDDDLDIISAAIASTDAGSEPSRPAVIGVL